MSNETTEHEHRKLTCIGCPLGCQLAVELRDGQAWSIEGYDCKKGKKYAAEEVVDPKRMLTTTVAVDGGEWARLPVRTVAAIPKHRVLEACRELHRLRVQAPVRLGDIVLMDAAGTGIPVIASRSMAAASSA